MALLAYVCVINRDEIMTDTMAESGSWVVAPEEPDRSRTRCSAYPDPGKPGLLFVRGTCPQDGYTVITPSLSAKVRPGENGSQLESRLSSPR
jgi:hypothetical protein